MPNIAALKAELLAGHPGTGAYNADDELAAGEGNVVNRTRNKTSVTGDEIFDATDGPEFSALSDLKKQLWLAFCGRETIDPFGSANVAFVQFLFGGGSTTIGNLGPLRIDSVSRFVELGLGFISPGHITEARAS